MIIHFTASAIDIQSRIDGFRRIVDIIHKNGHMLAQDWIEPAYNRQEGDSSTLDSELEKKAIYSENMSAIARADILVVEASVHSTGLGYQIAIAIQQKKPILLLRTTDSAIDSFIWSLEDSTVDKAEYDLENINALLESFFEKNDIQSKDMRFNFFIDRQIYNYLRWASLKTSKTKAEILRELVVREIEKDKDI